MLAYFEWTLTNPRLLLDLASARTVFRALAWLSAWRVFPLKKPLKGWRGWLSTNPLQLTLPSPSPVAWSCIRMLHTWWSSACRSWVSTTDCLQSIFIFCNWSGISALCGWWRWHWEYGPEGWGGTLTTLSSLLTPGAAVGGGPGRGTQPPFLFCGSCHHGSGSNPPVLFALYSHYFWALRVASLQRSRCCWFCSYLLLLEDAGSEVRL